MISPNDPAGAAWRWSLALRRAGHECRSITTAIKYNFLFPKDLHVPWLTTYDELEEVLATADVFHFHVNTDEDTPLGPFRVRQFLSDQVVVYHHHGSPLRDDPEGMRRRDRERGWLALVSTPDLLRLHPDAVWIPNPVPLDDPLHRPLSARARSARLRVGHSPTKTEIKNTEDFLAAAEGLDLDVEVIQLTRFEECLRRKRQCDLFFDHMQGYYGMSSLEAMAQGVATIAGLDDGVIGHLRAFTGADRLPWIVARTRAELREVLRRAIADPDAVREAGEASRRWMERYWDERTIARRLIGIYERLRERGGAVISSRMSR